MENEIIIKLQELVTSVTQQANGHDIQSRIFANDGFEKLADKYSEHSQEERDFVGKFIDRILDLGGNIENQDKVKMETFNDPIDCLNYDLQVSKYGLEALSKLIIELEDDLTTYELLKEYYIDEEEDMHYSEQQLKLIENIGKENWLVKQL